MYTHTNTYTHTHLYTHTHKHLHTQTPTHTHTNTYTHTHTNTYTHTHTHTPSLHPQKHHLQPRVPRMRPMSITHTCTWSHTPPRPSPTPNTPCPVVGPQEEARERPTWMTHGSTYTHTHMVTCTLCPPPPHTHTPLHTPLHTNPYTHPHTPPYTHTLTYKPLHTHTPKRTFSSGGSPGGGEGAPHLNEVVAGDALHPQAAGQQGVQHGGHVAVHVVQAQVLLQQLRGDHLTHQCVLHHHRLRRQLPLDGACNAVGPQCETIKIKICCRLRLIRNTLHFIRFKTPECLRCVISPRAQSISEQEAGCGLLPMNTAPNTWCAVSILPLTFSDKSCPTSLCCSSLQWLTWLKLLEDEILDVFKLRATRTVHFSVRGEAENVAKQRQHLCPASANVYMLAKRPIHTNYNNKKCIPPLPPLSVLTFLASCSADGGHAGCGSQLFQNLRGHWLEEVEDLVLQGHKLQVGPQGLETLKLWVGLQCTSVTLTSVRVAGKSLWPSAWGSRGSRPPMAQTAGRTTGTGDLQTPGGPAMYISHINFCESCWKVFVAIGLRKSRISSSKSLQCSSITLISVRVAGKSLWPSTSKCPGFSLQSTLIALTSVRVAAKSLWPSTSKCPGFSLQSTLIALTSVRVAAKSLWPSTSKCPGFSLQSTLIALTSVRVAAKSLWPSTSKCPGFSLQSTLIALTSVRVAAKSLWPSTSKCPGFSLQSTLIALTSVRVAAKSLWPSTSKCPGFSLQSTLIALTSVRVAGKSLWPSTSKCPGFSLQSTLIALTSVRVAGKSLWPSTSKCPGFSLQSTLIALTSVRVAGKSLWPSTSKCPGFSLQSTLIALTSVRVAAKSLWPAAWRDPGSRPVRAGNVLQSH